MPEDNIDGKNGSSSDPGQSHIETEDNNIQEKLDNRTPVEAAGLISTTEFEEIVPEDEENTGNEDSAEESEDAAESGTGDDEGKSKKPSFQDHPRWNEMVRIKNEALTEVQNLKGQVQQLTTTVQQLQTGGRTADNKTAYQDIAEMTDESIIENFEKNPKGFLANFAVQIENEIIGNLNNQYNENQNRARQEASQKRENEIRSFYAKYEEDNPDFVEMWKAGSIQDYMEENPGLTPVAAHKLMKADKEKSSVQTRIDNAVQEALTKQQKNFVAKRTARSLSGGPQGGAVNSQSKTSADLADTKQHGGLISVLAARSSARERTRS